MRGKEIKIYVVLFNQELPKKQKQISNPYQNANKRKLRIFPINTLSRLVCLHI